MTVQDDQRRHVPALDGQLDTDGRRVLQRIEPGRLGAGEVRGRRVYRPEAAHAG